MRRSIGNPRNGAREILCGGYGDVISPYCLLVRSRLALIPYKAYLNFQPKRLGIQLSRVAFLRFRRLIAC